MPPKYLYGKDGKILIEVREKILSSKKIILLSDYDGTLTPIVKIPSMAVLSDKMKYLLESLNQNAGVTFGIVTGRAHPDMNKLLGLKNVLIVSNHGYMVAGRNGTWIHPAAKRFEATSKKIFVALKKALKNFNGVLVQNKKFSLTVNYRNTIGRVLPGIKSAVQQSLQNYDDRIKITSGKKVVEVRPNIDWDKGKAVLKILKSYRQNGNKVCVLYLGDDKTDEDVFKIMKKSAVTVHVGMGKSTAAKYYLKRPSEVQKFLEWVELNL